MPRRIAALRDSRPNAAGIREHGESRDISAGCVLDAGTCPERRIRSGFTRGKSHPRTTPRRGGGTWHVRNSNLSQRLTSTGATTDCSCSKQPSRGRSRKRANSHHVFPPPPPSHPDCVRALGRESPRSLPHELPALRVFDLSRHLLTLVTRTRPRFLHLLDVHPRDGSSA